MSYSRSRLNILNISQRSHLEIWTCSGHQGLACSDHQTGASIVPGICELSSWIHKKNYAECHLDGIENIWDKFLNAPIFPYPNPDYTIILDCDASETAIGCELLHLVHDTEKVIVLGSYSLTPAQRRYCTTRKELLAVVRFTRQFLTFFVGASLCCSYRL